MIANVNFNQERIPPCMSITSHKKCNVRLQYNKQCTLCKIISKIADQWEYHDYHSPLQGSYLAHTQGKKHQANL